MRYSKQDQAESLECLRSMLGNKKSGTLELSTVLTHVSRSGMTRHIKILAIVDGQLLNISFHVARACNFRMAGKNGALNDNDLVVTGCGMDMGYHVISQISYALTQGMNYQLFRHSWL